MNRIVWIALLFSLATPSFANQTFIEGGFHRRLGSHHPRAGIGIDGFYAFNRTLKLFHPELMAGGWFGTESSVDAYYPSDYATARLDDTFAGRTFSDQNNVGLLATGRIVFDFHKLDIDSVEQGTRMRPELGFGVGGYQLFRKNFPARETSALAEIFFRLHFVRENGDTFLQISSVRSFGNHRADAINASFPKFAYTQISLGFELPVRKTVRTTH